VKRFNYLFFVGLFLFFGAIGLNRFASDQVRFVDALGLFASGMGCGASLCGFIIALRARRGLVLFPERDRPVSPSAPDELRTGKTAAD
jgi:hypothetical protein